LSRGREWRPADGRFFAVTITTREPVQDGAIFEASDGTRYIFAAARTEDQARAAGAASGEETIVFAVRPYWGMPARDWIAEDPQFWNRHPMASATRRARERASGWS
jgi:hypothetical protein